MVVMRRLHGKAIREMHEYLGGRDNGVVCPMQGSLFKGNINASKNMDVLARKSAIADFATPPAKKRGGHD
jgi:hypothetical protein